MEIEIRIQLLEETFIVRRTPEILNSAVYRGDTLAILEKCYQEAKRFLEENDKE